MNQKELDEHVTLMISVHKACRFRYPDEFLAKHRNDINFRNYCFTKFMSFYLFKLF